MSDKVKRKLSFYLHTHWDREWYWSFAAYRTQLLEVVKSTLEMLEDGRLDSFMLDGQTCMLDDVAELRPDLISRVEKLVRAGKLAIGPWYVLADQMLVGGESLIRNLAIGLKASRALGGASMVGYCPDTFGHSADLPRILRSFGIDNAVVWRGVPQLSEAPLFYWRSADGSEVLANLLPKGYYLTAFSENVDAEKLSAYLLSFLGLELKPAYICEKAEPSLSYNSRLKCALLPVGGDHMVPPADFKVQVDAAKKTIKTKVTEPLASIERDTFVPPAQIELRASSLAGYLKDVRKAIEAELEPLPLVEGELRENASAFVHEYAYMLAGVLSTRLYLKRQNRLAERFLLKVVEPLRAVCALYGGLEYPQAQLEDLWKTLLKNQPHDSICGCSVDSVHREMLTRFESLESAGAVLVRQAHEAIGHKLGVDKPLRLGLGLLDLPEPGHANCLLVFNGSGSTLSTPVKVRLCRFLDDSQPLPPGMQITERKEIREAFLPLSGIPDFKDVELVEGYLAPVAVPPLGFSMTPLYGSDSGQVSSSSSSSSSSSCFVNSRKSSAFDGYVLANEFFKVYCNSKGDLIVKTSFGAADNLSGEDQTFKLGHHLVDVGDGGDTYNFDPLSEDEPIYADLKAVRPGLKGPLAASFILEYEISLPKAVTARKKFRRPGEPEHAPSVIDFRRSRSLIKHKIETEITLKKGLPIVLFDTKFNNQACDHRLEVVFSTGEKLSETFSENHHSLIKRTVAAESKLHKKLDRQYMVGFGHEAPLDRLACQRFFVAAGQVFLNSGLPEYGAAGSKVSLTILRAVSNLSRARLRTRGGGAGPNIETPEANCLGPVTVSYGWAPLNSPSGDWRSAAYELADSYENPLTAMLLPAPSADAGSVQNVKQELSGAVSVDSAAVRTMAFYLDGPGICHLRLLNVEDREISCQLTLSDKLLEQMHCGVLWKLTIKELDGKEISRLFDNEHVAPRKFGLRLKPYQLITVEMCFAT